MVRDRCYRKLVTFTAIENFTQTLKLHIPEAVASCNPDGRYFANYMRKKCK